MGFHRKLPSKDEVAKLIFEAIREGRFEHMNTGTANECNKSQSSTKEASSDPNNSDTP